MLEIKPYLSSCVSDPRVRRARPVLEQAPEGPWRALEGRSPVMARSFRTIDRTDNLEEGQRLPGSCGQIGRVVPKWAAFISPDDNRTPGAPKGA
jgi:hypothetical protein